MVNAVNRSALGRAVLEKTLGVHREAPVPEYHSRTARKRLERQRPAQGVAVQRTEQTRGKVALFLTCYGNRNEPELDEDLVAVFEHNGIAVTLVEQERCCGMPRLELGDLEAVAKLKEFNIPQFKRDDRGGLRHRRAHSLLRADVQAGAAADVSGGCGRAGGARAHLRSVRISDAAPQGRPAEHGLQDARSAR